LVVQVPRYAALVTKTTNIEGTRALPVADERAVHPRRLTIDPSVKPTPAHLTELNVDLDAAKPENFVGLGWIGDFV
jgi:hypothetical protein